MILNEKSPLTIKVKSQKAELFFLQKTEATEISNRYPHIWKRIVNRSLHKIKQIKRIIRKKVILFALTYNIPINPEFKKIFLKEEKLESDIFQSQIGLSIQNKNKRKKEKIQNNYHINVINHQNKKINKNKNINIENMEKINENNSIINIKNNKQKIEDKESSNFKITSGKIESFSKEENNSDINRNIFIKENDIINIVNKELKKSNKNISNQITNVSINIYSPKIHIPLNKLNSENQNLNSLEKIEEKNENNNPEKINEISYNNDFIIDIKNNSVLMDNLDENSNIFYSNISKR